MAQYPNTQEIDSVEGGPQENDTPIVRMPQITTHYFNTSKIAQSNADNFDQMPQIELLTLPQKDICILVNVWTDAPDLVRTLNLTPYDMAIMDAIYTLSVHGCTSFSPTMIVRAMSGNLTMEITESRKKTVIESIERLRHIYIQIDCTRELAARGLIDSNQTAVYSSTLLPLSDISIRLNAQSRIIQGYHLTQTPAMYQYAERIHQIANIPAEMLRTAGISDTDRMIILKRYLVRRIALMLNSKNNMISKRIVYYRYNPKHKAYTGLYTQFGLDLSSRRTEKSRIHHDVQCILNYLAKAGYIQDYTVIRAGSGKQTCPVYGIDITLPRKHSHQKS